MHCCVFISRLPWCCPVERLVQVCKDSSQQLHDIRDRSPRHSSWACCGCGMAGDEGWEKGSQDLNSWFNFFFHIYRRQFCHESFSLPSHSLQFLSGAWFVCSVLVNTMLSREAWPSLSFLVLCITNFWSFHCCHPKPLSAFYHSLMPGSLSSEGFPRWHQLKAETVPQVFYTKSHEFGHTVMQPTSLRVTARSFSSDS